MHTPPYICMHIIFRELLELGEFEEARVYAEEFKLVRETIGINSI